MGFFSNKIDVEDLQPGDHIYTWRGPLYTHHGIYVGDGQVIHYGRGTRTEALEGFLDNIRAHFHITTGSYVGIYMGDGQVIHYGRGTRTDALEGFLDKIVKRVERKLMRVFVWSNLGRSVKCEKCNIHDMSKEVTKSCVECFLDGGNLYRCKYEAGWFSQQLKRPGTCTGEKASEVEKILHRAEYLLSHEFGFGKYDLLKRNCEDFALYCRVGIVGVGQGASAQAAPLKKTMARVKEIEVEDLVTLLQLQAAQPSTSA